MLLRRVGAPEEILDPNTPLSRLLEPRHCMQLHRIALMFGHEMPC